MNYWHKNFLINKKARKNLALLFYVMKCPAKSVAVNTNLHVKQVGAVRFISVLPSSVLWREVCSQWIENWLPFSECWVNIIRSYRASQGVVLYFILRQNQTIQKDVLQKSYRFHWIHYHLQLVRDMFHHLLHKL